jgi:hypothetical protein
MTRLLLCAATALALTASANAQSPGQVCWGHDACVGQNISVSIPNGNRCAHTIAKGNCYESRVSQPAQASRTKKKGQ